MRKIITIYCLFFFVAGKTQTVTGSGGPIQDNGQDTFFPLAVSGLAFPQIDSTFGLEQVCINITHPNVNELYIYLQSPSGTLVDLSLGSSLSGADYVSTCFDNTSGSSITLGTAPFTGTFEPVGYLGRFNTGQNGNGTWNLIVHDGFPGINAGSLVSWSLQFGSATPAHPVIFQSSNLPIVFINTPGPITDYSMTSTMGIVDNGSSRNNLTDTWNSFSGKIDINTRGHSSKNYPKKSYSIATEDGIGNETSYPQLGMPSQSDWVLSASYADKTLLRNCLTYDLFRQMGHYSPRFRNVELVLNNEYQGVYAFLEKPKRDINRINIEKLTPTDNAMPYVSGGYILKIDRTDAPGWYSYLAGNSSVGTKFYYQYCYPKSTDITPQQTTYIQTYMNNFESLMNSPSYADVNTGYPKYLDVNSFVDFFIINEVSKNVDAYRLSTYLYKQSDIKGGKLAIGPVWDYDIAWHNCNYGNSNLPDGWAYLLQDDSNPVPTWWMKFMQDTNFVNQLYCRWSDLRQSVLSINSINSWIDNNKNVISEAEQRNFKFWPVLGAYIYPNPQSQAGANITTEIADLKNWVANRISWLDANIWGKCSVGIREQSGLANNLKVYPNPMQQKTTFLFNLQKESDVSLCITDVAGKEVARYISNKMPQGDSQITFERELIRAGIYFYQIQIDNTISTGKIIIQ